MIHFAVAGVPRSTPGSGGTVKGLYHAHSLGITAMEMEWVQRVPGNPERIDEIHDAAKDLDMYLTVHAPYFINLNAQDEEKLEASKVRILNAMEMGQRAGAHSVCVHPAFYLKMDPEEVYDNVYRATEDIMKRAHKMGLTINLGFETMGKVSQFGTLEEVLRLSREFGIYPTVDTAHMHARSNGKWNSEKEWHEIFDIYAEYLGAAALKNMHMHYSGIAYTEKGERKHLPLEESDAKWKDFLKVVKDRKIGGVVVCESPLLEEDTILLRDTFNKLK